MKSFKEWEELINIKRERCRAMKLELEARKEARKLLNQKAIEIIAKVKF